MSVRSTQTLRFLPEQIACLQTKEYIRSAGTLVLPFGTLFLMQVIASQRSERDELVLGQCTSSWKKMSERAAPMPGVTMLGKPRIKARYDTVD